MKKFNFQTEVVTSPLLQGSCLKNHLGEMKDSTQGQREGGWGNPNLCKNLANLSINQSVEYLIPP